MEVYLQRPTGRQPIVIDDFTSFRWRRKYYDIGDFELHIKNSKSNLFEATGEFEPVIWFKDSTERGIVENVQVTRNEIALSGRLESKVLTKRVAIHYAAYAKASDIPTFVWDGSWQNDSNVDDVIDVQYRWNTYYEIIERIAKAYGFGFYIHKNTIYVYDGVDRTINQSNNARVVFTDDDLSEPTWTIDTSNHYDSAYVAGQGEGDDRIYVTVGTGSNKLYVDARDLTMDEITRQQYNDQLTQRGIEALAERLIVDTFESSVSEGSQYQYGRDYGLGDIVTIQMASWGKTQDFRITEVEEVWERGMKTVYPTFGDPLPEKLIIQG